jgi:hypothetical protein
MKWHEKSRLGQIPISILIAALLAKPNRPRLESEPPPPLPPKKCLRYLKPATQLCNKNKPIVNICQISANALHFNMKRPGIEFFQTSLYKLNRMIEESLDNKVKDEETEQALDKLLPAKH